MADDTEEQALDQEKVENLNALDLEGFNLHRQIEEVVADRALIEERWVEDYRQYLGKYDATTLKNLEEDERSSVFVNLTRPKTDNAEGQLVDMLFPNDDKNWGIKPTPVPSLMHAAQSDAPAVMGGQQWRYKNDGQTVTEGDLAKQEMEAARKRSGRMERHIEDQLIESDYNTEARKAIHYACILGTGVICGPEVYREETRSWTLDKKGKAKMVTSEDPRPKARSVLPWDFYPDMSSDCIDNAEFVFERSYLTRRRVRQLKGRSGYLEDQLNKLLEMEPGETRTTSTNIDELREMVGISRSTNDNRYEIWTYRGPVSKEVLEEADIDCEDGLDERDGVVVMAGTVILKVAVNPKEVDRWPYYVYNWEEDDNCIFGYSVPHQMRDAQRIINSAWRMMLDNASRSAGPQLVFNGKKLRPLDGDYKIYPWKQWVNEDPTKTVSDVFQTFNFPSIQNDLGSIFQMAQQLVNQETNLPIIAQGEQGPVTPTVGGMSMLMNAANASRRNQVKGWDDNVTKPLIRAFYDWNMMFSKDDTIKGDFEVDARGTSALLIKETQTQHIMAMLDKYSGHPVLGKWLKPGNGLKKLSQAQHIPPDELLRTEEEVEDIEQRQQEAEAQQKDPSIQVEELRTQASQMREQNEAQMQREKLAFDGQQRDQERQLKVALRQMDLQKAAMDRETRIMELSAEQNISLEKIYADLEKHRDKLDLDMSKFLTETDLKKEGGSEANYGLE